jgi:hypothetical protein
VISQFDGSATERVESSSDDIALLVQRSIETADQPGPSSPHPRLRIYLEAGSHRLSPAHLAGESIMEAQRFDNLTKSFASSISRRSALRRTGVGLAATMLAAVGLRGASARQAKIRMYTVIRKYTLSGSSDSAQQELTSGFLPLIRQAAGYMEYSVVVSADNTLTTIAVFQSEALYQEAAQYESNWVQQNLASLLPAPATETKGNTVIFDINTDQVCGSGPAPTVQPTVQPTIPATATATAPCTGIGCACNGGVQNACDAGLVCCQSQMGGGSIPGGAGMCAAADACGDGSATPVT